MAYSHSTKQRTKSRRWTTQQLIVNLEILSTFSPPLPFDLPSSTGNPLKRKLEHPSDTEHVKRPRISTANRSHAEDGEVPDESSVASSSHLPVVVLNSALPIRRPKRGRLFPRVVNDLHERYHQAGRTLKYSGDARFWSTYPATHKQYRPLINPPPPNSPYHKHGGLIARLELVDALVCFTYSIWIRDHSSKNYHKSTWSTIEGFLVWCKTKWQAEEGTNDAEKAFLGLIWMIEGFIHGRKLGYGVRGPNSLVADCERLMVKTKTLMEVGAISALESSGGNGKGSQQQSTPPMLPSPAASINTNSTNSTPAASRTEGTPNENNASTSSMSVEKQKKPSEYVHMMLHTPRDQSIPPAVHEAISSVSVPVNGLLMNSLREQTGTLYQIGVAMSNSQATLSLPVLQRHFPNTFVRMAHSTLSQNEEQEPDLEDEEGELLWPGQAVTGEGLGWVCLMGKAMISEFGKAYDYRGVEGAVRKPSAEAQRAGSTPQQPR